MNERSYRLTCPQCKAGYSPTVRRVGQRCNNHSRFGKFYDTGCSGKLIPDIFHCEALDLFWNVRVMKQMFESEHRGAA